MTTRAIASLLITAVAATLLCVGGLIGLSGAAIPCVTLTTTPASVSQRGSALGYDQEQMSHAATIAGVGVRRNVPIRGVIIAVATAIQESSLRNLGHLGDANDHDSLGLFQQRPSQDWGTPAQIMNPDYASNAFYDKLLAVAGWQLMPLAQAAQSVQKSAYPNAYAKWEGDATSIVNHVASRRSWAILGDLEQCVSSAGWTHPLPGYKVTSGFRTVDRPSHDGADLPAPKGTPIRAAAVGEVIKVRCNAIDRRDGTDWGCDRDGDPELTGGCGWYLELLHPGNVMTRYCHLNTAPHVKVGDQVLAGQPIGVVGSTGHSSGSHLHLEVHLNTDRNSTGQVVDPVPFLHTMGVLLSI